MQKQQNDSKKYIFGDDRIEFVEYAEYCDGKPLFNKRGIAIYYWFLECTIEAWINMAQNNLFVQPIRP